MTNSLIGYIPSVFSFLQERFDDVFDDIIFNGISEFKNCDNHSNSYPRVNVFKNNNGLNIEAAVPGLDDKGINISYSNGKLSISGEFSNIKEEKNEGYIAREIHKSSFNRQFAISDIEYNIDKITAKVNNGLLVVNVPFLQSIGNEQVKRISITQ